ncbi:hypothetical protein HK103_004190 [Boothiomyces macroporosus]|uniref:Uncharacterized protein n=1 Tax=Boothiomyces macroporosus TaxID=261099 RepID=A0AAD5Y3L9_9FUNG|nr:hypothetical protein HK103_004190 [Boothiomyces macroporosus]
MERKELKTYEISYQREQNTALSTINLSRPLRVPTPPQTIQPIDWSWVQVNKKNTHGDSSDSDSLEIVSLHGSEMEASKTDNVGGLLGLGISRKSIPTQFHSIMDQPFRAAVLANKYPEKFNNSPSQDILGSFIMMDRTSSRGSFAKIDSDIPETGSPKLLPILLSDLDISNFHSDLEHQDVKSAEATKISDPQLDTLVFAIGKKSAKLSEEDTLTDIQIVDDNSHSAESIPKKIPPPEEPPTLEELLKIYLQNFKNEFFDIDAFITGLFSEETYL